MLTQAQLAWRDRHKQDSNHMTVVGDAAARKEKYLSVTINRIKWKSKRNSRASTSDEVHYNWSTYWTLFLHPGPVQYAPVY